MVDLGPFLQELPRLLEQPGAPIPPAARDVARQWREAFSSLGFAQIRGHGVPDKVIEDAYSTARRFFGLSPEEKGRCDLGKGYGPGGFTPQGSERVSATLSKPDGSELQGAARARPPDRVESMLVHRRSSDVLPSVVEGYKEAVYSYCDHMEGLLRAIMSLTACSLELPLLYFEEHFSRSRQELDTEGRSFGDCTLRLAYYPAWQEGQEPPPGQLRYGEHTDYTGFTILWQDHNRNGPQLAPGAEPPAGGLQVRTPAGEWIDCPPLHGAFTINAGDLIQVWTNDVFLSNTHRVINPPPGDRDDRISLVYFTGPKREAVIEALPTCWSEQRPKRYNAISAALHLQAKLDASNR